MKNLILTLVLILSALGTQAQTKLGTIDAEYILAQMPENSKVEDSLKAYNLTLQEDLQATIKKYETAVADYQANNTTYTEEIKKTKEGEIIGMENEIKNFRQKASLLLQMKRNELTSPLYKKIDEAMKAVISSEGYTQILNVTTNGLAYADPKFDITDTVLQKLGLSAK
ncbi:OmpH family outer membrane protein [Gillisia sp. M10.2A]|uniref:OmpH family outer membrane protein n=1 Tax=Gillisia lutea TaxID=2909668 RepID=A0ABS9EM05_9FLAO|nr:OmpH family outer membrane protein [Gillisia lutea]MCF4102481.1 OmpH family outer membrane protein [Gillisia lutea]